MAANEAGTAPERVARADYQFELTIILPPSPFSVAPGEASALMLPASSRELVRELKAVVVDSPEGFWLGNFAFVREGDEAAARLGDWDEIGAAFAADAFREPGAVHAVRVVEVPLDEPEARTQVLRLRDILNNVSPAFNHRIGFNRQLEDPTSLGLEQGCSQYLTLRASQTPPEPPPPPAATPPVEPAPAPLAITNGEADDAAEPANNAPARKRKAGHGKAKSRGRQHSVQPNGVNNVDHHANVAEQVSQALVRVAPAPVSPPQPGPSAAEPAPDPLAHVFQGWSQDDAFVDPFAPITRWRTEPEPLNVPLLRNVALSPFTPPPQHLRLRGVHLSVTATTVEGQTLHLTASQRGWYVDRSSARAYNAAPRAADAVFPSIFGLLAHESPAFVGNLHARLQPLPPDVPDVYANAPPSGCIPVHPWLVRRPDVEADAMRLQLPYLHTGQTGSETIVLVNREWNEEFVQVREMPRATRQEKVNRDRSLARLQAEFSTAAARAVQQIVRGELLPINPQEPRAAQTYLHNNILFVSAEDPQGHHADLGGEEAARATTLKDLAGVRILNAVDAPDLHSVGTTVVDYLGERWLAQALLPGLLGPVKPEEPAKPAEPNTEAPAALTEVTDADDKAGNATDDSSATITPGAAPMTPPEAKAETLYKIIYGSSDTERPERGTYTRDAKCHEGAVKLASQLHLSLHTVRDAGSDKATELALPIDVKGILGTDGRTYLIDLYRLQPVDITWLETDLNGPLLSLQHPPVALAGQPHTNGVNGVNGHTHTHSDSDSDSSGPSTPPATTYPHHYALIRPQLLDKFREDELRRYIQEKFSGGRISNPMSPHPDEPPMEWQRIAREAHLLPAHKPPPEDSGSKDVLESVAAAGHNVFEMSSFEVSFHPEAYVERRDGPRLGCFPENERSIRMVRAVSMYLRDFALPDFVSDVAVITPQPHDGAELTKQMHDRGLSMRYLGYMAVACEKAPRGLPEKHAPAARTPMACLKVLALNEMVFRAAKHILRRLVRKRQPAELAPLVSHFLNCLVGDLVNARPRADLGDLAPADRASVGEWARLSVSSLRDMLAREVACRFRFTLPRSFYASADFARPQLLRDMCTRCGIQLLLRRYHFARDPALPPKATTVTPDDVLNLLPVIHDAPHRAAWIDEMFEQGQGQVRMNNIGPGEQMIGEAVQYAEQVYGSVHPDIARKYHELAVLWHSVATPIMRNVNVFEHGHALSSSVEDRVRSTKESGLESREQAAEAKREGQAFLELAVRHARQSVIVAERCFGLDHAETLQNYIDLAILEHANDHSALALFFCQHALNLCGLLSRRHHPDWSRIMLNASQILQSWQGYKAAVDMFKHTHDITAVARGTETHLTASVFTTCAAAMANAGRLKEAVQLQKEALVIFAARFGEGDERVKDAEGTLDQLTKLAVRREKGEADRIARLARRMRTTEDRAREILARGASASIKGKEKAAADEAAPPAPLAPSFAHLDIDEIVQIIEAGPSSTASSSSRRKA